MLSLPSAKESDHCPEDNFVISHCICDHYPEGRDARPAGIPIIMAWQVEKG